MHLLIKHYNILISHNIKLSTLFRNILIDFDNDLLPTQYCILYTYTVRTFLKASRTQQKYA